MRFRTHLIAIAAAGLVACGGSQPPAQPAVPPPPPPANVEPAAVNEPPPAPTAPLVIAADIDKRLAKFAAFEMDFNEASVAPELKPVLKKLVEANQLMHELFMQQIDPSVSELRGKLAADPANAKALEYFDIMAGPWDTLAHDEPFIGDKKRPAGGAFYPVDLTKDQFEAFVQAHPDQKEALLGYFTIIRRGEKDLEAVPYSQHYKDTLEKAAKLLREAAALSNEPTLKTFLEARANAFLSNEYRESDKAWMDVRGPIEVTIGPYEVYADQLMGLKATFESFVSLRDIEESKKLETVGKQMDALERNLPLLPRHRNPAGRATASPIDVVHLLCNAGQSGVQTVAYNLPNDEVVRAEKGSKKVMMKNVLQGKFERIVKPIAAQVLDPKLQELLNFESMFTYILMHEVAHGLGPGIITLKDGTKTDVNKALKEVYPGIEEPKADIAGLVSAQYLIDRKIFPKSYEKEIYVSYLATVFRQVRFGVAEAHGKGAVASFNYLVEKGAIKYDPKTERYDIDFAKIKNATRDLAREYLTFEGDGDYAAAKAFLDKYAVVSPDMQKALDRVAASGLPIDIAPRFTIYEKIKSW